MAFWGVEVKPGKPYTHQYDSEQGRLRLSQATLGSGSSTKKSIVQCNVGDKKPIYLCSLLPERLETCPLNLEFEEDDEVTFSVVGPHSVHLSGFFYGENDDNDEDDYAMDPYEEDIAETESGSDDSIDYDSEDEDEDDFIDDDLDMYPPSPIPNSGVKIEEILDDEKPASENDNSKRQKKAKKQMSDDNGNAGRQIVVKTGSAHPVLESEDEDGFPVSSPRKNGAVQKPEEKKDERASEKVPKKKTRNDTEHHKNLKRKIDVVSEDGENARKTGQQSDSLLQTDDAVPENDAKQKKRDKKKKVGRDEEITNRTSDKSDMEEVKVVEMENGQKPTDEKEKEKKKKKKKNKKEESAPDSNAEQSVAAKKGSTATETKPYQVRTFSNGLVVEELAIGKPDGKRASNGKKVSVRYIGKLKNNGKIFDSNIGKAPFKFRLGVGQVIKGWDVGVNGMRVGDKRRLTIPPSMGYGKKGAGAAIPPNAWLVFDVELVDVN